MVRSSAQLAINSKFLLRRRRSISPVKPRPPIINDQVVGSGAAAMPPTVALVVVNVIPS